ncbi:hypothetical protein H2248_002222 [Termitomyces sp. 'cryptogamus']|nr:hypothetical protein H2248_002222 [Termitomyces sp. 'cryptogamus']
MYPQFQACIYRPQAQTGVYRARYSPRATESTREGSTIPHRHDKSSVRNTSCILVERECSSVCIIHRLTHGHDCCFNRDVLRLWQIQYVMDRTADGCAYF